MTLISEWGPIIWKFFHTIVESVNEDNYNKVYKELFQYIKSICNLLPCPQCSNHAKEYLKNVKDIHISTKNDFRNMLFNFHNDVNKRNNKVLFKIEDIEVYKRYSLVNCYNNFIKIFSKKGNFNQINQSFQRKLILQKYIKWMQVNKRYFNSI
jgi:hypothetical protein